MTGLSAEAGELVARAFGLGADARLGGPVARGQLGQVWRLETGDGVFAIKEWFVAPDVGDLVAGVALSERLRAAGVPTPKIIRTGSGDLLATVNGITVRAFEWVNTRAPDRRIDPAAVGQLLAAMHRGSRATAKAPTAWYTDGLGPRGWEQVGVRLEAAGAPFARQFGSVLGELVAVESVIEPPEVLLECHRDLWSDNVLVRTDGRGLCVVDFDDAGPADPSQELAMTMFEYGLDDPARVRRLAAAYTDAGGPGRVSRLGHFSMLVAIQAHLARLACTRWIGSTDTVTRSRSEALIIELLDDVITLGRLEGILASLDG